MVYRRICVVSWVILLMFGTSGSFSPLASHILAPHTCVLQPFFEHEGDRCNVNGFLDLVIYSSERGPSTPGAEHLNVGEGTLESATW